MKVEINRLFTLATIPLVPISMAAALFVVSGATTHLAAKPAERVIAITAKRFQYSQKEIVLKKGVPVTLELTSIDVVHGFNLPDFKLRADLTPGKVTRIHFVPDKVGTFLFHCDNFCGTGHEEMDGVLKVVA
ncbi:MAG TPA: cupredoxin domain-containing protein [Burkholderiales bacterium]|nr:cupredoxin domain-containing protein [Burkholderiales bacterium]